MPFDLKDYTDVKERIRLFYEQYPDGRLVTDDIWMAQDPDGKVRVWGRALAYRTVDDPLPGKGTSFMEVPGATTYTRGSEAENVETSAWGRAIGSLGLGIAKSIATSDEISAKDGEVPAPERTDDGGLIGIAEVGKARDSDFELRQSPDGWTLGFRLKGEGRGGIKVLAKDDLAEALALIKADVVGRRVTCWGRISDETFTPKNSTRKLTYHVLQLERIQTSDWVLPATAQAPGQLDLEDIAREVERNAPVSS